MKGVSTTILEREGLRALMDARLEVFLSRAPARASDYCLRMTSGTTNGAPLFIVWDNEFTAHGLFSGVERLVICTGSLAARSGNALLLRNGRGAERTRVMCADIQDMTAGFRALMDDFQPTALYGFSSFVRRAAMFFSQGIAEGVQALLFASEPVSPALEDAFRSVFPNASIRMVYHTNETGAVSKPPCGHLPLDSYHLIDGVEAEIDDPDETGAGDVLLSKRVALDLYVDRYRIGDIGRLRRERCPCGEELTLQLLGRRGYDYIRIAGALLVQQEFERVAGSLRSLFDDYRAEASSLVTDSAVIGRIVLRVYRKDGVWNERIAKEIGGRFSECIFLTPTKTLSDLVQDGVFLPLLVEYADRPFAAKLKELKLTQRKD